MLKHSLINKGKIVSRVDMMGYLWNNSIFVNDSTLTVNIIRIIDKNRVKGLKNFIKIKRAQDYLNSKLTIIFFILWL